MRESRERPLAYLVIARIPYEDTPVIGVFSDETRAEAYAEEQRPGWHRIDGAVDVEAWKDGETNGR